MTDLNRFIVAQDSPRTGLAVALAELRAGQKRSHWIWYVFPQLAGLGHSPMAEFYGIADLAEAEAYVCDARLRGRLLESASAVVEQIERGIPLETLMGADVDVLKLVSSMTLFESVARRLAIGDGSDEGKRLGTLASTVLDAALREGYPRCVFTLAVLNQRA